MNLDLDLLPERCDAIVVGAGPAGAACAQLLARAGRDVVARRRAGVPARQGLRRRPDPRRAPRARAARRLRRRDGRGALGDDARLHRAARRPHRGAGPARRAAAKAPRRDRLPRRGRRGRAHVRAGALRRAAARRRRAPTAASSARACSRASACARSARRGSCSRAARSRRRRSPPGMCDRRTPSGIALRGYIRNPALTPRITSLEVVWHKRLSPGYGWIFPCGDDVFNIGVGVAQSHREGKDGRHKMKDVNLREVFAAFKVALRAGAASSSTAAPGSPSRPGAEGRAAALLARGRAPRGAGHPRHRRGGGQHLRVHRRGHRQGDGDRHPCRRGDPRPAARARSTPTADAAVRADYAARVLALKPRFDALRGGQPRQRASVAGRPAGLERQAQPAPGPAHGRRARGDAHPDRRGHACAACCGACSTGADALRDLFAPRCRNRPRLERHRRGRRVGARQPRRNVMDYMLMFYRARRASSSERKRPAPRASPTGPAGWPTCSAMHAVGHRQERRRPAGRRRPRRRCASPAASGASRTVRSPTPRSSSAASSSSRCPTSTRRWRGRRARRARPTGGVEVRPVLPPPPQA